MSLIFDWREVWREWNQSLSKWIPFNVHIFLLDLNIIFMIATLMIFFIIYLCIQQIYHYYLNYQEKNQYLEYIMDCFMACPSMLATIDRVKLGPDPDDYDFIWRAGNRNVGMFKGLTVDQLKNLWIRRDYGLPSLNAKPWYDACEKSEKEGNPVTFQVDYRRPTGGLGHMTAMVIFIRHISPTVSRFMYYIVDMSDNRGVFSSLKEHEQKLKQALEGTSDGVWEWNCVTQVLDLSPSYLHMLGYPVGYLDNTFESWKKLLHPDDVKSTMNLIKSMLNKKPPLVVPGAPIEDASSEGEFRLKKSNGEYLW